MGAEPVVRDNIASLLEAVADAVTAVDPQSPAAVHAGRRSVTWAQFDDRAARLAGHLSGRGIGRGDRVGIGLHNSPEYLESLFAVLKLRAVPVNVNYRYGATELEQVARLTRMRGIVAETDMLEVIGAVAERVPELRVLLVGDAGDDEFPRYEDAVTGPPLPRQTRSSDDQILLLTGGTTGLPKGVVWDSGGVCGVVSSAYRCPATPRRSSRPRRRRSAEGHRRWSCPRHR